MGAAEFVVAPGDDSVGVFGGEVELGLEAVDGDGAPGGQPVLWLPKSTHQ